MVVLIAGCGGTRGPVTITFTGLHHVDEDALRSAARRELERLRGAPLGGLARRRRLG